MALRPGLQPNQSQQIALTPQLKEAISILQMSNIEVRQFVNAEVEANPVLEYDEDQELQKDFEAQPMGRLDVDEMIAKPEAAMKEGSLDANREGYRDRLGLSVVQRNAGIDDNQSAWENVSAPKNLQDHLHEQVAMICSDEAVKIIAHEIVDELEDDGYLRMSIGEIAECHNKDARMVKEALSVVQSCEPTGVGARDLAECYRLQLLEQGLNSESVQKLVSNINLLTQKSVSEIAKQLGISECELNSILDTLRQLDRAPGEKFARSDICYVTPDVFVTKNPSGAWTIEMNSDALPKVIMNNQYRSTVFRENSSKEFFSNCVQRASWLGRVLDQRAKTIVAVVGEIVRVQSGFFENGIEHLKPMTMRQVADNVDVHESTVSRVVAGKFLSCKLGLFELRYFFSKGVSSHGGGDVSAIAVQDKIRRIVDREDPHKVLSDDKIMKHLKDSGIDIARRTVTKYRENMQIPSSVERRRIKTRLARIR